MPVLPVPRTRTSSTTTARSGMVKPNSVLYLWHGEGVSVAGRGSPHPEPGVPAGTHRLAKAAAKSPARQEPGVGGCPLAEHIRAQSVRS